MSATIDADKFSSFFNIAPIFRIKGRLFPVKIMYLAEPERDVVEAALKTTFQLHLSQPPGDILIFLPGQAEIEALAQLLEEYSQSLKPEQGKLQIAPLYAALSPAEQSRAFDPPPKGTRKVIISTNIAETSVTVPGVRYVIDSGLAKIRRYNHKLALGTLLTQAISKSAAKQRSGRAGREAPGVSYRLYREDDFILMTEEIQPEILRTDLAFVVLALKSRGVNNVLQFEYLDKPSRESSMFCFSISFFFLFFFYQLILIFSIDSNFPY